MIFDVFNWKSKSKASQLDPELGQLDPELCQLDPELFWDFDGSTLHGAKHQIIFSREENSEVEI